MTLRPAEELLTPAVQHAIDALDQLSESDAAAVKLALRYASTIDNSRGHCRGCHDTECRRDSPQWAMRWLGPLLLDCLDALGATPAARARLRGGKPADAPPSQLAKLRAARRA